MALFKETFKKTLTISSFSLVVNSFIKILKFKINKK